MSEDGKWVLRFIVHHSGEDSVGDSFDGDTLVEIPLSARHEHDAEMEGKKMIREMDLNKLKPFYESSDSIMNEDLISIDKFEIVFSKIIKLSRKILQQWF